MTYLDSGRVEKKEVKKIPGRFRNGWHGTRDLTRIHPGLWFGPVKSQIGFLGQFVFCLQGMVEISKFANPTAMF